MKNGNHEYLFSISDSEILIIGSVSDSILFLSRSETYRQQGSDNYTCHIVVKSSSVSQSGKYHCAANPGQSQHITVHVHHGG